MPGQLEGGTARPGQRRWRTLRHHGVAFPPLYAPTSTPVGWKGQQWLKLPADAEESAAAFARLVSRRGASPLSPTFLANFWKDWSALLPKGTPIKSLEGCDFSRFLAAPPPPAPGIGRQKATAMTPKHATAIVDGREQPVVGFRVEPGGIFAGRGHAHPLAGRIKRRVRRSDVTLNLDASAPVPPGRWRAVVHDPFVDWLAAWHDPLLGVVKYARLAPSSSMEQGVDADKFERARALDAAMPSIHQRVEAALRSSDLKERQVATCISLLDSLALRVGDGASKGRARGLTSLLVRHVDVSRRGLRFDFVGKDGVPYVRDTDVPAAVQANVRAFLQGKGADQRVFDRVSPSDVNAFMGAEFTAKDLRTRRASLAYEHALERLERAGREPRVALRLANARVAFVCNHRVASKAASERSPLPDDARVEAELARLEACATCTEKDVLHVVREAGLALSTSMTNYIDPRIGVAFCTRHRLPMDAALGRSKALAAKFSWALGLVGRKGGGRKGGHMPPPGSFRFGRHAKA